MQHIDDKSIEINHKIIKFEININKILEYKSIVVVMIREKKEVPNNIIAYNHLGEEIWKINDIVRAKIPRGYDKIEKKSNNILIAYCELGIIFEIDIYNREIISKTYLR